MGSSKKQTVGYHYKYLLHYGICRAPIDAFLEWRGGDRPAWVGHATSSQTISVNAPNLWGGEKNEGGIVGNVDLMFGEQTQMPNAWLIANQGPEQTAYRGKFTFLFKGGRFGINPYPKSVAFKFRRILKGWDNDDCWYPETAPIIVAGTDGGYRVMALTCNDQSTPDGETWQVGLTGDTAANNAEAMADRYVRWNHLFLEYSTDAITWTTASGGLGGAGAHGRAFFKGQLVMCGSTHGVYRTTDGTVVVNDPVPSAPRGAEHMAANASMMLMATWDSSHFFKATEPEGPWTTMADAQCNQTACGMVWAENKFWWGGAKFGAPRMVSTVDGSVVDVETLPAITGANNFQALAYGNGTLVAITDNKRVVTKVGGGAWTLQPAITTGTMDGNILRYVLGKFYWMFVTETLESVDAITWTLSDLGGSPGDIAVGPLIDTRSYSTLGMNPAHMILDSLISQDMQGEPWENINEASFIVAANKLFAEGFGLITTYDHQAETSEQFQERICNVIGASLSQSRIDGKYRLDLIRGDYVLANLPILTDADILEYAREPSNPNDSVNEVVVEWFDPVKKEKRSTTPIQSLGAIQAAGATISETAKYPEVPNEGLALRLAARDLKNKSSPLSRFKLVTTRKPFGWRAGTFFRLQVPRRGIADMVCQVGELSAGTLRSGAMTMVAIQHVGSLPDTTYVEIEPGIDTEPNQTPDVAPQQIAFEAPYVELAGTLGVAELAATAGEIGYVVGAATQPDNELNYTLYTKADGEAYAEQLDGDWCPSALVVEASALDPDALDFTLSGGTYLDRVTLGTAALWGDEMVRVDALNVTTGAVTFGRACGDTVLQTHAAGERIWFYDAWGSTDGREYVDGETVSVKFITNTASQALDIDLAPESTVIMDQRAARPYAPAGLRVNAFPAPDYTFGAVWLTWTHRDRLLQASLLVDDNDASIGPEPDVTYTVRWYIDNVLVHTDSGITADTVSYSPGLDGTLRIELEAVRDGLSSWQMHVRELNYTVVEVAISTRITTSGDRRVTTDGDERITEE